MYKRNARGWGKHLDFIILDIIVLQLSYILSFRLRNMSLGLPYSNEQYRLIGIIFIAFDLLAAIAFNTMHNVLKRTYWDELKCTIKHVFFVFAFLSIYMFAGQSGDSYSRITIYLTAVFHIILGYGTRLLWKRHLGKRGVTGRRKSMIVVSDEENIRFTLSKMQMFNDRSIVGIVLTDENGNVNEKKEMILDIPVVADLNNAVSYIIREWVDEVFIDSISSKDTEKLIAVGKLVKQCHEMGVTVHERLRTQEEEFSGKTIVEQIGGYAVLTTGRRVATPGEAFAKRMIDIIGGLVGSFMAVIIMFTFGIVIKLKSPGSILYKQTRIGYNGKRFQIYKLRTMVENADELKGGLYEENRISDGMMFKLDFDPRIVGNRVLPDGTKRTGIGQWLRFHSIDEFPQFFNVIKNDMSLVGTRPPTVDEWEKYELRHRARLAAKPGVTGLWQVSGRSKVTDFEKVVKLDTAYIQNWTLGLDIKIMLRTIAVVFSGKGAL